MNPAGASGLFAKPVHIMIRISQFRDSVGRHTLLCVFVCVVAAVFFFLGGRLSPKAALLPLDGNGVRYTEWGIEVDVAEEDTVATVFLDHASIARFVRAFVADNEPSEPRPVESISSADAPATARFVKTSRVDHAAWNVVLEKDGYVHFGHERDGEYVVDSVPHDMVLWASEQQKGIFYPDLNIFSLFLDPANGLARWSFVYSQTFWQLVVYISLALLVTLALGARRLRRQRNRLVDENRRLMMARESEREHLAVQIHDGPIQDAQLIAREFASTLAVNRAGDRPAQRQLDSAMDQLVNRLRDICAELRPPVLYHFGLADAIRCRAAEYEERFPEIRFETYLQSIGHLPDDVRIGLFRIAQEAIGNAVKHADASRISVRLFASPERISMWVEDDGVGLPPRRVFAKSNRHQGMSLISHLARAINADIDIASEPGEGTRVMVNAPLPDVAFSAETGARIAAV